HFTLLSRLPPPPPPTASPPSPLSPYTTLFRSRDPRRDPQGAAGRLVHHPHAHPRRHGGRRDAMRVAAAVADLDPFRRQQPALHRDRKSTRLNSSHEWISYAVFCLKKNTRLTGA